MLRVLLCVALVFTMITLQAQVTMTLQIPPEGALIKPQLWNISVTNNGDPTYVAIALDLTDNTTGDDVLTAITSPFLLATGTTQLQASDISVTYNYVSSIVVDQDPNGFLPLGNFDACYTINRIAHDGVPVQQCINIIVEPISPPLLNIPADESTNESRYPQFNWLPPTPQSMFSYLTYDLILVEVNQGQTAAEAIQQNVPLYSNTDNENIFCNYPSAYAALDTSKLYAWQVIAKNNYEFAAQSEVWTFRVKQDSTPNASIDKNGYIKLQRNLDASIATCNGIVKFFYNNPADDTTVTYQITSLDEADLGMVIKEGIQGLGFGENYVAISLTGDDRLIIGRMYLLQVTNSRNETWSMKFVYQLPDANADGENE